MSYSSMLEAGRTKIYQKAIATKILDMVTRLINTQSDNSSRRWIWELIQNAKDVACLGIPSEIEVELTQTPRQLIFRHNGMPFSIKNIMSLINQVSGKDRGGGSSTGKFGTGFLATHLLSRRVQVSGVVCEEGEETKRFCMTLDRSGSTLEAITASVETSMEELARIDLVAGIGYMAGDMSTEFVYTLDEKGCRTAKAGIDDFRSAAAYMLAFVPGIASITLKHIGETYRLAEKTQLAPGITRYDVQYISGGVQTLRSITISSGGDVCVAAELGDAQGQPAFCPFSDTLPRIFCDFPLIGTEGFGFPAVINSREFNLTEPRDGIYLAHNGSLVANTNEKLLAQAQALYLRLLGYAAENKWGAMFHIVRLGNSAACPWLDNAWFESCVERPLREKIERLPIVKTCTGEMAAFSQDSPKVIVPSSESIDCRQTLKTLFGGMTDSFVLPCESDIDSWFELSDLGRFTLNDAVEYARQYASIGAFEAKHTDKIGMDWYCALDRALLDDPTLGQPALESLPLLPDQTGVLKTTNDLYQQNDIPEPLKDAAERLGVSVRHKLIDQAFELPALHLREFSQYSLVDSLSRAIQYLVTIKFDSKTNAVLLLLQMTDTQQPERQAALAALMEEYLDLIQTPWEKPQSCSISLKSIRDELETYALRWLCDNINHRIRTAGALLPVEKMYGWYARLLNFISEYRHTNVLNTNKNYRCIFPNQAGSFSHCENLYTDSDLDGKLIDIAELLDIRVRQRLINADVSTGLKNPLLFAFTNANLADELTTAVLKIESYKSASANVQKGLAQLFDWLNRNPEQANRLMPAICARKYTLCDAELLDGKLEASNRISGLMQHYGMSTVDELEEMLKNIIEPSLGFADYSLGDADYAKAVGDWGERYALSHLTKEYESASAVVLRTDETRSELDFFGERLTIQLMDSGSFYNAGYDIKVSLGDEILEYIEVKSTVNSVFGQCQLSFSQFNAATRYGNKFRLILITEAMTEAPVLDSFRLIDGALKNSVAALSSETAAQESEL